jgi:hypothetical protein
MRSTAATAPSPRAASAPALPPIPASGSGGRGDDPPHATHKHPTASSHARDPTGFDACSTIDDHPGARRYLIGRYFTD